MRARAALQNLVRTFDDKILVRHEKKKNFKKFKKNQDEKELRETVFDVCKKEKPIQPVSTSKKHPKIAHNSRKKWGQKKGLKLRFEFFMNFYSNFFPRFRCHECARGALEAHTQKSDKIRGRVEDSFLLNK